MTTKKTYKLELTAVLNALDRKDYSFYSKLTEEERKGYTPLILMRFMSSLTDQNRNSAYAVLASNDLVNIGFWELSKYPDLQHLLLCLSGINGKQYRPWIASKKGKSSNKIDRWLFEQYPDLNNDEIDILKSSFTLETWKDTLKGSDLSDQEIKELVDAWKKQEV